MTAPVAIYAVFVKDARDAENLCMMLALQYMPAACCAHLPVLRSPEASWRWAQKTIMTSSTKLAPSVSPAAAAAALMHEAAIEIRVTISNKQRVQPRIKQS
jgi:hypothetical protein